MAMTKEEKTEVLNTFKTTESDTGSPEVQVALMSNRITYLTEHFKTHKKDHHSRRRLIALVNNRKKLLNYLKKKEESRYLKLIEALGIRK